MSLIVADSSVLLKWIIQEKDSHLALLVREKHLTGETIIAVPDLLFYEVANILATKTLLPPKEIFSGFEKILSFELEVYHLGAEEFISALA